MMLRDYLSKDMSSCSSGGFQSFPRRRCCSLVHLLADSRENPPPFPAATDAALKDSPFASSIFPKTKLRLLPRCLSRKLLRRRGHRKKPVADGQVVICLQAYFQMDPFITTDSQFPLLDSPENVEERSEPVPVAIDHVTLSDVEDSPVSSTAIAERWTRNEKEHHSPVSVLDYDEKDVSSNVNCYARSQSTGSNNAEENIRYSDELSDLDPVDLLDRYTEADSNRSRKSSPLDSANWGFAHPTNAEEILKIWKLVAPGFHLQKLVTDLVENDDNVPRGETDQLGDWLKGNDVELGWHSEQGRVAYLRDVERHDDEVKLKENERIASEIEEEAFNAVLEEEVKTMLLLDYTFYHKL